MQGKLKQNLLNSSGQIDISVVFNGSSQCYITKKAFYFGIFTYLKAVFESFAHQIQSDWIYAGIQGGHVDANVVQYQQKAAKPQKIQMCLSKICCFECAFIADFMFL